MMRIKNLEFGLCYLKVETVAEDLPTFRGCDMYVLPVIAVHVKLFLMLT
jgi:hypothetical protein